MARKTREELQTSQDICRAEFLVALVQGLTREESAAALRRRATADGVSLHAAALAMLTAEPADELLTPGSSQPGQAPIRRHLYALRSLAAEEATATTSEALLSERRGRHRPR